MKLTCNSCQIDFQVDEKNLDTEKVDCPVCRWPNLILRQRFDSGYFGQFLSREPTAKMRVKKWPKRY
jgi:hypothetical protein